MNDLFDLSMPWWAFAVRGSLVYLVLLVMLRLTGKHSFGEMSPFDIVVMILVGGTMRSAILGKDSSVLGPLIAVSAILATDKILAHLAANHAGFNRLLEGVPVLLARAGRADPKALRSNSVSEQAFERELRLHGAPSIEQVEEARLEPNGRISVLKREVNRDG